MNIPSTASPITDRRINLSQISFGQRLRLFGRQFARARRRGNRPALSQLAQPQMWEQLWTTKQLDGLSLYRQALTKIAVPQQLLRYQGKTILLVTNR